jgi:preprotein translocase subunit YajC
MRLISGIFVGISLALTATAAAQAQGAITVGMQVTDASGGPVGTVTAINGDNVQVKTDKHEALLPKASFSFDGSKLLFGMTQAQLDTEIEKSQASADAAVAAGATVKGLQGTSIGKIDSVSDSGIVISLLSGKKIQVARTGVRGNPDGTVTVGLTADQLEAATKATGGAAVPGGK